jgi:aminodeoxyfutalosine synthase
MHGDRAYFNVNRHINPTNVCVAACRLCAFGRKKDTPGAYTMALEEAFQTAASGYTEAVTEFHIVGGLHPDLPFQYFLDLVSGLKQRFPQVHLKAFTMVEVAYLAKRAKLSIRETLQQMKAAGVDSLPGGGAEIFADRVRHIICDHKIDGDDWLDTARIAHPIDEVERDNALRPRRNDETSSQLRPARKRKVFRPSPRLSIQTTRRFTPAEDDWHARTKQIAVA